MLVGIRVGLARLVWACILTVHDAVMVAIARRRTAMLVGIRVGLARLVRTCVLVVHDAVMVSIAGRHGPGLLDFGHPLQGRKHANSGSAEAATEPGAQPGAHTNGVRGLVFSTEEQFHRRRAAREDGVPVADHRATVEFGTYEQLAIENAKATCQGKRELTSEGDIVELTTVGTVVETDLGSVREVADIASTQQTRLKTQSPVARVGVLTSRGQVQLSPDSQSEWLSVFTQQSHIGPKPQISNGGRVFGREGRVGHGRRRPSAVDKQR